MTGAGAMLEEQAGKMTVTLGGALTVLKNNFAELVNETLNGSGAMSGVAQVVKLLADNLGLLSAASLVVATVYGGRYIASLVAAAAAKRGQISLNIWLARAELSVAASAGKAAAAQTALAMAGRGLLAVFGGPVGLIFAGTALVGTWAAMDIQNRKLAESMRDQRKPVSELVEEYTKLNAAQKQIAMLGVNKALNTATVEVARSKAHLRDLLLGSGMGQYVGTQNQAIRQVFEDLTNGAADSAAALEKLRQIGGYPPEKLKQIQDAIAAYQGYAGDVKYATDQQAALNGTFNATQSAASSGATGIQAVTRTLEEMVSATQKANEEMAKLSNRWANDDEYNAKMLEFRRSGYSQNTSGRMARAFMETKGAFSSGRALTILQAMRTGQAADAVNAELQKIEEGERVRQRATRELTSGRNRQNGRYTSPYRGNYRITSGISAARTLGGVTRPHHGVDVAMPVGTELRAMADGIVKQIRNDVSGYGKYIDIQHRDGVMTRYAHLSSVMAEVGQAVRGGQLIALSGNSGRSTGPHLHMEARRNGRPFDFRTLIGKDAPGLPSGIDLSHFYEGEVGSEKNLAQERITSLKGQLAMMGLLTEQTRLQKEIELGKYGEVLPLQQKELNRLAAKIDHQNELKRLEGFSQEFTSHLDNLQFEADLLGKTAEQVERLHFARQLDLRIKQESVGASDGYIAQMLAERDAIMERYDALQQSIKAERDRYGNDWIGGIEDGARRFMDSAGTMRDQFANMTESTIGSLTDGMAQFAATGKLNFREMTVAILQDLAKIYIRMAMMKLVSGIVGSFGGGYGSFGAGSSGFGSGMSSMGMSAGLTLQANGGAWQNGVQFFANGGVFTNQIVGQPTMFAHGGGFCVMGEAGPEAIMPLTRAPNGKLGVVAHGSGGGGVQNNVNITVTVNQRQSESDTQADSDQGRQVAKLLDGKIVEVLVRESHPGGLLHQR